MITYFLSNTLIFLGAMLLSFQLQSRIFIDSALSEEYNFYSPLFFLFLLFVTIIGAIVSHFTKDSLSKNYKRFTFLSFLLSAFVIFLLAILFLPNTSSLQLLYFVVLSITMKFIIVYITPTSKKSTLLPDLRNLWNNRMLLKIWTQYNVRSRYSQTFLGIAWIVLLPLSTSIILSFVFSQIIRVEIGDGMPYISFFLTGLTVWGFFSQGVLSCINVLVGSMNLINQVYFPREILILIKLGEALVDLLFTFAALLIINGYLGIWPNINFIFLPILLVIQIIFMLSLMLFFSALSVFIRDIPQLINILLQLLFYLTPVLYPVDMIPEQFRWITLINPLASLVEAYRSIIVYNLVPDIVDLYYPIVVGVLLLFVSYRYFKFWEKRFADYR